MLDHQVICPICNEKYKCLTKMHLAKHGIKSVEEFDIKYPNHPRISEKSKKLLNKTNGTLHKKSLEIRLNYLINPKMCKICNNPIQYDNNKKGKFCSHKCQQKYNTLLRLTTPSYAMNAVRSCKLYYNTCKICQKIFIKDRHKSFCSGKCLHSFRVQWGIDLAKNYKNQKPYKQHKFNSKYHGEVLLDSGWEVKVVQSLEDNNIKWERGKGFEWIRPSDNTQHKYYPDFYLPDYDVYVEPKNPYKWSIDYNNERYKVEYVIKHHNIKIIVLTNKKCLSWEYIQKEMNLTTV